MPTDRESPTHASAEDAIMAARVAKATLLRGRGENPFANDLGREPLADVSDLRKRFEAARGEGEKYDGAKVDGLAEGRSVHVAGRLMAVRAFGKATFLRL